jgi:hypothetical protein
VIVDFNIKIDFLIDTNEKNKFKISKKFFVERRVEKIIKHQIFKMIMKSSIKRSIKFRRFKLLSSFSKLENAFDDGSLLNIKLINVVIFYRQANKKNKKKRKIFFMTIK